MRGNQFVFVEGNRDFMKKDVLLYFVGSLVNHP